VAAQLAASQEELSSVSKYLFITFGHEKCRRTHRVPVMTPLAFIHFAEETFNTRQENYTSV
jgi:hypothetical protein